jgi:hypothetical protein
VADVKAEVNRSIELEELKKMKEPSSRSAARNVEQTVSSEIHQTTSDLDAGLAEQRSSPSQSIAGSWRAVPRPGAGAARVQAPQASAGALKRSARCRSGTSSATAFAPRRNRVRRAWRASGRRATRPLDGRATRRPACRQPIMSDQPSKDDELEGTEAALRFAHLVELRDRLDPRTDRGRRRLRCAGWCGPGLERPLYDMLAAPLVVASAGRRTTMIATNVISPFLVPLKITLLAAFLLALPIVLYQVWAFVAPGLYKP